MPDNAKVRMRCAGRSVPMPNHVELTDDVLWLLGLWVAEGSWHRSDDNAFLTGWSADAELLERAAAIIERQLGLHVVQRTRERRAGRVDLHSFPAVCLGLMEFLGFGDGSQADSRMGPRSSPQPAEVVHRGLSRG